MEERIALVEAYIHFRTGKSVRINHYYVALIPAHRVLLDKAYNHVVQWAKQNNASFNLIP